MKLLIRQIEIDLNYNQAKVINAVASRLKSNPREIKSCEIIRRSLDARPWRKVPVYILSVEVDFKGKININKLPNNVEKINDNLIEKDIDFLLRPGGLPIGLCSAHQARYFAKLHGAGGAGIIRHFSASKSAFSFTTSGILQRICNLLALPQVA